MGSNGLSARAGRLLRSPRLAIALLSAFTAACLVGNLAPQVGTAGADAVAAWQAAHPGPSHLLQLIGGFSLFTTPWFLVLTGFLALSTLACTLDQFRRARKLHAASEAEVKGAGGALPASAPEVRLALDPAAAARLVAAELRRLGLRVRQIDEAPAESEGATTLRLLGETVGLGRWSSPLFHLGLVLIFCAVIAGAFTQWTTTILLAEGGTFDPLAQAVHGDPKAGEVRPALAGRIPPLTLDEHLPRYQLKRYSPDSASRLIVGGRRQLVSMGRPLTLGGVTLRQARRYGALAEVVFQPVAQAGQAPTLVRRPGDAPPPDFGGPAERPDGSFAAGLVFMNQENAEQQRRPLYLPMLQGTATFRLLPQEAAADYRLPLYRRFQLAVSFTPDVPAGEAPGARAAAVERYLRPGESLTLGGWRIFFPSLRYWTTFSVTAAPLTPVFFLLGWGCIAALGLGLLSPPRRVEAVLMADAQGCGSVLRHRTTAGRGGAFFAERVNAALSGLEEVKG